MMKMLDPEEGKVWLESAGCHFRRSIRLNPVSAFSHFYYAQTLQSQSLFQPEKEDEALSEYKKAALLAGHNSEIYYEVGKIFLGRWPQLSEENRSFTVENLRRILSGQARSNFQALLNIWEFNVQDYEVMKAIIPNDAQLLRTYALYLAQKSLSLEERHLALARAEALDFEAARQRYITAETDFKSYELESAARLFRSCIQMLNRIVFYQDLTAEITIDPADYAALKKSCFLHLIRCGVELGRDLSAVEPDIRVYLTFESGGAELDEMETYLVDMGVFRERIDQTFDNWELLSIQLRVLHKKNAYREIMSLARQMNQRLIAVPETQKELFVDVLAQVGESYLRVGHYYDAESFFNRALETDAANLDVLMKLREVYVRLNNASKIDEMDRRISEAVSPGEMRLDLAVARTKAHSRALILDGEHHAFTLRFQYREGSRPLVSVFLNDHILSETFLEDGTLTAEGQTRVGRNILRVQPWNVDVRLLEMVYR
jgi:tetratricopeptide (TPR) repeat protein